jgi:ribosomal protein L29
MGANMSEYCQCEPRLEVGKQVDDNQAPESKASLHQRGPVSRLSREAQSIPRLAKAEEAPEEIAPEEMAQRLEALKKYQADLKAKKEAGWKDKWQQADNARQTLQQQLAEASNAQQDEPKRQPVKFERSFSIVSKARVCWLCSAPFTDLRHTFCLSGEGEQRKALEAWIEQELASGTYVGQLEKHVRQLKKYVCMTSAACWHLFNKKLSPL